MDAFVLVFFIHSVLATLLIGGKLFSNPDRDVKRFGVALLLDAVAFIIWTVAVVVKPVELEVYTNLGAVFFIASVIAFLNAGMPKVGRVLRQAILLISVILGALVLYMRLYMYPSSPSFSDDGYFFFNLDPIIQMIYIFALVMAALPAIDVLASKLRGTYAIVVRYAFIAEVVGGIILIINTNSGSASANLLLIDGWIIGIAYFALWSTIIFNKNIWNKQKTKSVSATRR